MKKLRKTFCLLVAFAMLMSICTSIAYALPTGITADPWTRTIISGNEYGVLFYNEFDKLYNSMYPVDTPNNYGVRDYGMTTYSVRNSGKDKWESIVAVDDIRGNALETKDSYNSGNVESGAYFGSNTIKGKKFNFSIEARKQIDSENTTSIEGASLLNMELYAGDSGTYTNLISGKTGHNSRKAYFIELTMDKPNGTDDNGGAGSMFNGLYTGMNGSSAKVVGLDDTDWHQIDGVLDVSGGAENAVVKLFVDGTQIYTKSGDIITENGFDVDGNFVFNAVKITGFTSGYSSGNANNPVWSQYDNFKITNTEGDSFGVHNVKKSGNIVYTELTNSILAGQTAPAISLRKVGTSNLITPASVSFEGSQAIKIDLTGISLDEDAEYQLVYPEGLSLKDINERPLDAGQIVSFYNDGEGNGVKSARLIGADGTSLSVPQGKALKGETGMVLEFEEALTNPTAALTINGESKGVTTTSDGTKLTIKWDSVAAEAYELVVKDGDEAFYTYKKVDIAEINPIIPDNSYGIIWSNDFEYDTSGYDFKTQGQQLDFGNGMIAKTVGSSDTRQRLEDMEDEYHEQVFTGDHVYSANIYGTKTFDSEISGQIFNFSAQIKTNAYNPDSWFNAFQINLYEDTVKKAAGLGSGDDSLLNIHYDSNVTGNDNWNKSTIGLFSRIYGGNGGGYYVPGLKNGLDDTEWHQLDVELDATKRTIKFFLDGAQVGEANSKTLIDSTQLLNNDGSFSFDTLELNLRQEITEGNSLWSYIDNFILTKIDDSASTFGVNNVKLGTDVVYAELSATVASGQNAPAVTLRKVGTDEVITPGSVSFEGSQAIKIAASGLDANAEYQVVYPEGTALADINGRALDTKQIVTFYTDGEGAGVKEARLVNIDNTLQAPTASPSNNIKGIMIKTEAEAASVTATLASGSESVDVAVTGSGSDWIIGWNEFLDAKQYTLTVSADGTEVYSYVFTPVVSGELSISDFAVYDADGNEVLTWNDSLRGKTLKVTATVVNPTGTNKYACVSYATYADKYLRSVCYDNNEGNPVEATFGGTPIEVEFVVSADATSIKAMLWSGLDTMKPLKKAIAIGQ